MNRSEVQAFIDGFIKAGGDPEALKDQIPDWMDKHPLYPQTKAVQDILVEDIESYRGIPKKSVVIDEVVSP